MISTSKNSNKTKIAPCKAQKNIQKGKAIEKDNIFQNMR